MMCEAGDTCTALRADRGVQFELPVYIRKQLFDPIAPQLWVPNAVKTCHLA